MVTSTALSEQNIESNSSLGLILSLIELRLTYCRYQYGTDLSNDTLNAFTAIKEKYKVNLGLF